MSKIRKLSGFSKFTITMTIFMCVLAVVFSVGAASGSNTVFAAETKAGTAKYTSVGQTALLTTYEGGSGSIIGSKGLDGQQKVDADDFSFSGDLTQFASANANNQVQFDTHEMSFVFNAGGSVTSDSFYLYSRKAIEQNSTLFKVLADRTGKYDVRAELTASSNSKQDVASKFLPSLSWNDGSGSIVYDDTGIKTAGSQVQVRSRQLSVAANASQEPTLTVELKFPSTSNGTAINLGISDVRVTFIVILKDTGKISAEATAKISGINRSELRDTEFNSTDITKRFVKANDTLKVKLNFTKDSNGFVLGEEYKAIYNSSVSAVKWTASLKKNTTDEAVVQQYDNIFDAEESALGQTYTFQIPHIDGAYNNYVLVLKPSLRTNTASNETLDALKNISIVLTIDVKSPNTPDLSANCDLMKYLELLKTSPGEYWTNSKIGIVVSNQNQSGGAKEYIYYTVKRAEFAGATEEPNINSHMMDPNLPQLNFFPGGGDKKPGTFAIAMVLIDEAGNSSGVKTFNNVFNVDDANYNVNVKARLGRTGFADDASGRTEFGVFTFSGNTAVSTSTFKRGQTVTLVYSFSDLNLRNFYLANVYNDLGNSAFSLKPEDGDVIITTNTASKRTIYTITFVMDKTDEKGYIDAPGLRSFTFEFKQRIYANATGQSQEFQLDPNSKDAEGVAQNGITKALSVASFYYYENNKQVTISENINDRCQILYGKTAEDGSISYSSTFFTLAGDYKYKIELFSDNDYYCYEESDFKITKAKPGIADFQIKSYKNEFSPDGLASIQYGTPGGIGLFSFLSKDPNGALSDTLTSIGLRGQFRITNMGQGETIFDHPSVGKISLIVEFHPEAKNARNGVLNSDNFAVSAAISAEVSVVKKNVNDVGEMVLLYSADGSAERAVPLSSETLIYYNGNAVSIFLNNALLSKYGIGNADIVYEYRIGSGDYGPMVPIGAGKYNVRATISKNIASYTGSLEINFEITQQSLDVRMSDSAQKTEYVYGYFSNPQVLAGTKGIFTPIAVAGFKYAYRIRGATEFLEVAPQNAGVYEVQISVLDVNYEGVLIFDYQIRKVKTGDQGLTVNNPSPQTNPAIGAALRYGMPLSEIITSTGSVSYVKADGTRISVKGNFSPRAVNGTDPNYVPTSAEILKNSNYTFNFAFVPTVGTEDELNFEVIERASTVEILPAIVSFSGVSIPQSSYGESLKNIVLTIFGKATYRLYNSQTGEYVVTEIADGIFTYNGSEFTQNDIPRVGNYNLSFRFTAAVGKTALFRSDSVTLALSVIQNAQTVYVVNNEGTEISKFIKKYGTANTVLTTNIKLRSGITGLEYVYRYYKTNVSGVLGEEITEIQKAAAGDYFLQISVKDANYSGGVVLNFQIDAYQLEKGTNLSQFPSAFSEFEWGTSTFSFQSAKDMSGTIYRDDITDQTLRRVNGTFSFINDNTFTTPNLSASVQIRFTPTDSANYLACEFELSIVVNKRTVTFVYNGSADYNAEEQFPIISLHDNGTPIASENQKANVVFANNPRGAGSYAGTATVDASVAGYRGTESLVFEIKAQAVQVAITVPTSGYVAGGLVMPEFSVTSETGTVHGSVADEITVIFRDHNDTVIGSGKYNGVAPTFAPQNVGKYTLEINVDGNHQGTSTAVFNVRPSSVSVDTVVVVDYLASATQKAEITPIREQYEYSYTISYREAGGSLWVDAVPKDVGAYEVRISLHENGFMGEYPLGIKYTINPLDVTSITADGALFFVYALTSPTLKFTAHGMGVESANKLNYTLQYTTASGEALSGAPAHVGNYKVEVILDERNYRGTTTFDFHIQKGEGIVNEGIITTTPIAYKAEFLNGTDALFANRGSFVYHAYGIDYTVEGIFAVLTEGFSAYGVGTHNVTYEFVPKYAMVNGIRIEILPGDIEAYRDITSVSVVKKTLTNADFDVVSPKVVDGIAVIEYDETQKGVSILAKSTFFSPKEVKDVQNNAVITYQIGDSAATTARPSKTGEYTVIITVKHVNYQGGFEITLKIVKASPSFTLPTYVTQLNIFTTLAAGDVLTSTSNEPMFAYFTGKSSVPISGTFTVKQSTTFDKANLRSVTAVFTPEDTENIDTVEVVLNVYVAATAEKSYVVDDTWFEEISVESYGNFLNVSMLSTKGSATDSIYKSMVNGAERVHVKLSSSSTIYGDFRLKTDFVLTNAGLTLLPVYFVPDEAVYGEYQIVPFYATVKVKEKAVVRIGTGDNGIVYATVAAGSKFRDAVFTAEFSILSQSSEGALLAPPMSFRFVTSGGFNPDTIVPANVNDLSALVRAEYLGGTNYQSENVSYEVRFVFAVQETGILAEKLSYEFHLNHALSISENGSNGLGIANYMKISFSGAGDTIPEYSINVEEISVPFVTDTVYGLLLYEVGVYKITITISKNSGYYGTKTFLFEIVKRDIGQYVTVNGTDQSKRISKVYLETLSLLPKALAPSNGEQYDVDFVLKYRAKSSADFTESAPVYAGEYTLRVEVDSSERYTGHADFLYVVEKKSISIAQNSLSYTYGNAAAILSPRLDGNVKWEYNFTDINQNITYNSYPQNVGTYVGKVFVADENFQGTTTFNYSVFAAQVSVVWTIYNPIVYGQTLAEAVVKTAGVAMVSLGGTMSEAKGKFVFETPGSVLNSGTNSVPAKFIPLNTNYETVSGMVSVEVNRAEVTISITQKEFRYLAEELKLNRIYTVYPVSDIIPTYVIRKDSASGAIVQRIVDVGTYYIVFTIDTVNYYKTESVTIQVLKGTPDVAQSVPPKASPILYGQLLKNSILSGGSVLYNGKKVDGTFRFMQEEAAATGVGIFHYPVQFTPSDSLNYAAYSGYVADVKVDKAPLEISVSNTESIYGDIVTAPTFSVNTLGGATFNFVIEGNFKNWIGKVMPSGTIATKVTLDSPYYTGAREFVFTVLKKTVGIKFFSDSMRTDAVETYASVYGDNFVPYPGVDVAGISSADSVSLNDLNNSILVEYRMADGTIMKNPPKNASDSYYVLARYVGQNYNGSAEIRYTVKRATVSEIRVNSETLNKQIYGSVVNPNIVTIPAGVAFSMDFGNGQSLPQLAGNYNMKVTITDPNYEKGEKSFVFIVNQKKLGIENIVVADKPYDGVSGLTITGTLVGLMINDEVALEMTAETMGAKSDSGDYSVKILTAQLKGRHAGNYKIDLPTYSKTVKIYENRVEDKVSGSYIVLTNGAMLNNMTVEFKNAVSSQNKENILTSLLGQKAQVVSFSIKTDGIKTDLSEKVKVYIKIPDRFKNAKNLSISGLGSLAGTFIPSREGDYFTFLTAISGEIVFEVSDFPYGLVLVCAGGFIGIFGILAICIFEPIRKKKARKYKLRDQEKE